MKTKKEVSPEQEAKSLKAEKLEAKRLIVEGPIAAREEAGSGPKQKVGRKEKVLSIIC